LETVLLQHGFLRLIGWMSKAKEGEDATGVFRNGGVPTRSLSRETDSEAYCSASGSGFGRPRRRINGRMERAVKPKGQRTRMLAFFVPFCVFQNK